MHDPSFGPGGRVRALRCAGLLAWALFSGAAAQENPKVVWSWTFTPPSGVNDNVETVLGAPDLDGDGIADALLACEDYTVRALAGGTQSPPALIWTFGGTDEKPFGDRTLHLAPDRDGDGRPEVLFATGANDRSVHLLRGSDGAPIWSFDLRESGCTDLATVYAAVAVGDLNGDGVADVAAASGDPCRRVVALDGAGSGGTRILWQFVAGDGFWNVAPAGDLSGDGVPDVLAGCGANNLDNRGFLLDGREAPDGARDLWAYTASSMVADLATLQDFTGDGVPEVVLGAWDGGIRAVDGASRGAVSQPLWQHNLTGAIFPYVTHTIPIPDVDGDCVDEVLVGSYAPNVRVLSGATGAPLWNPTVLGGLGTQAQAVAAVPDVTGDLHWDLVVGTWNPGKVALVRSDTGAVIWEWEAPDNVASVASIGDQDGDGLADVLAGVQDVATAYALSGRTTRSCVRPTEEVTGLRASRLEGGRILLQWEPSPDRCHDRYAVYGIPSDAGGCLARFEDLTPLDEDGDDADTSWTGPGDHFGYLVLSVGADGSLGPLGHFRR